MSKYTGVFVLFQVPVPDHILLASILMPPICPPIISPLESKWVLSTFPRPTSPLSKLTLPLAPLVTERFPLPSFARATEELRVLVLESVVVVPPETIFKVPATSKALPVNLRKLLEVPI